LIEIAPPHFPLTDDGAPGGNPPQGFVDRGGVVTNQRWKTIFKQSAGLPGVVVGDSGVDVMAHMGGADAVMQQVQKRPIGTIHCL